MEVKNKVLFNKKYGHNFKLFTNFPLEEYGGRVHYCAEKSFNMQGLRGRKSIATLVVPLARAL
jgi:hypothetical protein